MARRRAAQGGRKLASVELGLCCRLDLSGIRKTHVRSHLDAGEGRRLAGAVGSLARHCVGGHDE